MSTILEFIQSFGFTASDWTISLLCGFLIGTAKAGLSGTGLLVVPVMAIVFGGKSSTGIVLPMLGLSR